MRGKGGGGIKGIHGGMKGDKGEEKVKNNGKLRSCVKLSTLGVENLK